MSDKVTAVNFTSADELVYSPDVALTVHHQSVSPIIIIITNVFAFHKASIIISFEAKQKKNRLPVTLNKYQLTMKGWLLWRSVCATLTFV